MEIIVLWNEMKYSQHSKTVTTCIIINFTGCSPFWKWVTHSLACINIAYCTNTMLTCSYKHNWSSIIFLIQCFSIKQAAVLNTSSLTRLLLCGSLCYFTVWRWRRTMPSTDCSLRPTIILSPSWIFAHFLWTILKQRCIPVEQRSRFILFVFFY